MNQILSVKDLKIYYKTLKGYVKAVDGVTFSINQGEILGVAGESGCGKSTLGNGMILLKPPMYHMGGEINLLGDDLMQLSKEEIRRVRYKKISIIPQYAMDAQSPTKKVGIFIKDIVREHGIEVNSNFWKKVEERLSMVNLSPSVLKRYAVELSGGMKQRLIMVISTLLDPALLIADEVTSALDVTSQRFVCDMLLAFRDKGIVGSVFFITHDISVLNQVADRIMVMYAGHLVEIGPKDEIIENPIHPYTKALISSLPKSDVRYEEQKLRSIEGAPPSLLNIGEGCRFRDRCPVATRQCEKETPPLVKIKKGHFASCWNIQGER